MGDGVVASDKLRGGYYTPAAIARWLCTWAIESSADRVLEPSCGDGVFLETAAERLVTLGGRQADTAAQLRGVEITPAEALKSVARLQRFVGSCASHVVHCGDFFYWAQGHPGSRFDCVIGNPPFIRYQNFPEPSRSYAMAVMKNLGLRANKLTNIWVPFVAAATDFLAPKGRLAMVLPAELLQVSYAAQLRSFLADHFETIHILACNEMLFPGAQQEVILLLARGRVAAPSPFNKCRIDLSESQSLEQMLESGDRAGILGHEKVVGHDSEKWLKYFLTPREISFMRDLRASAVAVSLRRHATIDIGVVTGSNDFFVVDNNTVNEHGLSKHVIPLIGRSAQLKGAILEQKDWAELVEKGDKVFLFYANGESNGALSAGEKAYVLTGEESRIHLGYKCSIRDPWYRVPSVWVPDAFLFRQIYDFPRIVLNKAGATSTDTIHRMMCKTQAALLLSNLYTHLTAASAEIEGRSYGGGVLELEPTEAERLLAPLHLVKSAIPLHEIDAMVRGGNLEEALRSNDKEVLAEGMGLSLRDCAILEDVWTKMRDRRIRRRKRALTYATHAEEAPYSGRHKISESVRRTIQYASKNALRAKSRQSLPSPDSRRPAR
jgi:adenine-specific DNA methylase